MVTLVLLLIVPAFGVSLVATGIIRRVSLRTGAVDTAPMAGQVKFERRPVPNTGGVGIVIGLLVPLLALVVGIWLVPMPTGEGNGYLHQVSDMVSIHRDGLVSSWRIGLVFVASIVFLHILGLIDDRRPLGPYIKLACMAAPAIATATFGGTRLLELFDALPGGVLLSVAITVLWFLTVTNAMNFMDNMDGLAGGVGAVCTAGLLAATLMGGEWFVAGLLSLLLGSLLGFLRHNAPPASIFMGDGGSLVLGYALAFLSVRATYVQSGLLAGGIDTPAAETTWFRALTPLVVLAVPLYDLVSVTVIRLSQGKSPFVGDLQHFSHRLLNHGLSKRDAVLVICGFTAATAIGGVVLTQVGPVAAVLVGVQTAILLMVLAAFEWRIRALRPPASRDDSSRGRSEVERSSS